MPANSGKRLWACRYWALGPQCPNTDAFGTNVCAYAHWDTGQLSSHFHQRGTCISWAHLGYCGRGVGCWYEHRNTGVTGLYQGTIELTGFELKIADTAAKAGFDTWKHEALFDLIWAVKRVALQAGATHFHQVPVPRNPIYPDRYRPGGYGGKNRNKKGGSKANRTQPNHSLGLKFHPVAPLARKRPLKVDGDDAGMDLITWSDDENDAGLPTAPNVVPKRQKMSTNIDIARRPTYGGQSRQFSGTPANSRSATIMSRDTSARFMPSVPSAPDTAEAKIIKHLLYVKTKLDDARTNMNTCQASMKTLFDDHYGTFDNDNMMAAMSKLSDYMNKVFDGGKDGAGEVEKAIAFLSDKEPELL